MAHDFDREHCGTRRGAGRVRDLGDGMSKPDTAEAIVRKLARLPFVEKRLMSCAMCGWLLTGRTLQGHKPDCLIVRSRAWVRANAKTKDKP